MTNDAFEMDPPKSPWRYPQFLHTPRFQHSKAIKSVSFRQDVSQKPHLAVPGFQNFKRTDSQDSSISSDSACSADNIVELHVPNFQNQFKRKMSNEVGESGPSKSKGGSKRNSETSVISGLALEALAEEVPTEIESGERAEGSSSSPSTSPIGASEEHRKISQESDGVLYTSRGHQNVSR